MQHIFWIPKMLSLMGLIIIHPLYNSLCQLGIKKEKNAAHQQYSKWIQDLEYVCDFNSLEYGK